jgi:hypothetical protein
MVLLTEENMPLEQWANRKQRYIMICQLYSSLRVYKRVLLDGVNIRHDRHPDIQQTLHNVRV